MQAKCDVSKSAFRSSKSKLFLMQRPCVLSRHDDRSSSNRNGRVSGIKWPFRWLDFVPLDSALLLGHLSRYCSGKSDQIADMVFRNGFMQRTREVLMAPALITRWKSAISHVSKRPQSLVGTIRHFHIPWSGTHGKVKMAVKRQFSLWPSMTFLSLQLR